MTIFYNKITAGFVAVAMLATPVLADPKPKGGKPLDAQSLANLYAGTSVLWKSCKGGIYYGAKYEAQAYCNKKDESVGVGKWSVDRKGRICQDLVWYWPKGKAVGSKKQDKEECITHLVDGDGQLWRNWTGEKDWWRFDPKDRVKGFKMKRKVGKLRRKLSI